MAQPTRPSGPPKPRVPMLLMPVWDLPSRLFLWLTAAVLALHFVDAGSYVSAALLALVLFRVAWGFVGSETARFRHAFSNAGVGHDPAGGGALLAWLLLLAVLALTGLAPGWEAVHRVALYAAGAAATVHVVVRIAQHRQDLANEWLRGRQRLPANLRQPRFANPALAAAVIVAAGAAAGLAAWFT